MKVSGAYWRADQQREQLQRHLRHGFFFQEGACTPIWTLLEEAKQGSPENRGPSPISSVFIQEAAGMPFFHPRGMIMWNTLLDYWRGEHQAAGYVEVKTPVMLDRQLWEKSGHWENYRENMYVSEIDGQPVCHQTHELSRRHVAV